MACHQQTHSLGYKALYTLQKHHTTTLHTHTTQHKNFLHFHTCTFIPHTTQPDDASLSVKGVGRQEISPVSQLWLRHFLGRSSGCRGRALHGSPFCINLNMAACSVLRLWIWLGKLSSLLCSAIGCLKQLGRLNTTVNGIQY